MLQLAIDESGTVTDAAVVEAEPQGDFETRALAAAREARFRPDKGGPDREEPCAAGAYLRSAPRQADPVTTSLSWTPARRRAAAAPTSDPADACAPPASRLLAETPEEVGAHAALDRAARVLREHEPGEGAVELG